MGFKYSKRSGNGALTEKSEIVLWPRWILKIYENTKKRVEGQRVVQDETCINIGEFTVQSPQDAFLDGQTTSTINSSLKDKYL